MASDHCTGQSISLWKSLLCALSHFFDKPPLRPPCLFMIFPVSLRGVVSTRAWSLQGRGYGGPDHGEEERTLQASISGSGPVGADLFKGK